MDREMIIQEAIEYARKQNWRVENYVVSTVKKKRAIYWVHFQGKSGLPGDHFSVWVDSSSGKATKLFPGN